MPPMPSITSLTLSGIALMAFVKRAGSGLSALLLSVLLPGPLALAATTSEQEARAALQAVVLEHARVPAKQVSVAPAGPPRMLENCPRPEAFLPHGNLPERSRITLGLRCAAAPETRYVPVELSILGSYVVAGESIDAGTVIQPEMLRSVQGNLLALPSGAVRSIDSVIGMVARQRIPSGGTVRERQLERAALIERGQRVTVIARGTGFQVSREGEAMQAGAMGDAIQVRVSSRERLEARIVGPGQVAVQP